MHTYNPSPPELPCSNMYTFAFLPPDLLKTELKLIVYGTDRRRTRKKCKIHKTFSALLHFISPKNFYITKELLYPQRTFISPISFYITKQFLPKKQNNKIFCTWIYGNPGQLWAHPLKGASTGHRRKKFESSAYCRNGIRVVRDKISREGEQNPLETPQLSWITEFIYTKYNNFKKIQLK